MGYADEPPVKPGGSILCGVYEVCLRLLTARDANPEITAAKPAATSHSVFAPVAASDGADELELVKLLV